MLRFSLLAVCLVALGGNLAHAGAVAYFLDDTVVDTMNHFTPSGNTGLAGGWSNNGFVGAGDGTAYLLDGSTMYHVTQSGLSALPGTWNNGGFVGAGDGTAYLMDNGFPFRFTPSGGTAIPFYSNSNITGFVGLGDGTAFILEGSTMTHLTSAGASSVPGGWNNNGFVGAGDGTAYILDGTSVFHITPSGATLLPFFGVDPNNINGFVGAGDGTAFIIENTTMYHLTPTGATSLPGGWNNLGFVGAGFVDTSTDDADFDDSLLVDGNDFLIWQRNFPTNGGAVNGDGDANLDGNVLGDDLTIWENQYGGPPAVVGALASVPEPNSLALVLLAILLIRRVRL